MPRPRLPGDLWVNTRIKLTHEQHTRLKAYGAANALTDAAVVMKAVVTLLDRVPPSMLKAYKVLRPNGAPVAKSALPPPPKHTKVKKAKTRK